MSDEQLRDTLEDLHAAAQMRLHGILECAAAAGVITDPATFMPDLPLEQRCLEAVMLLRRAVTPTEEDRRLAQIGKALFNAIDVAQAVDISDAPENQRLDKVLEAYGQLNDHYKRLEAAFEKLAGTSPKTGLELVEEIVQLKKEVQHWKANHDNQVEKTRLLMDRTDLPVERVQAYRKVEAMEQQALMGRDALTTIARWDVPPRAVGVSHRQITYFREMAIETLGRMLAFDTPLEQEVRRLQDWIDRLQAERAYSCLYCGTVFNEDPEIMPDTLRTLAQRHMMHCKKHPVAEMRKRFRQFVADIEAPETGRNRELFEDAKRYFESLDGRYEP